MVDVESSGCCSVGLAGIPKGGGGVLDVGPELRFSLVGDTSGGARLSWLLCSSSSTTEWLVSLSFSCSPDNSSVVCDDSGVGGVDSGCGSGDIVVVFVSVLVVVP